jgi:hypothetical protein
MEKKIKELKTLRTWINNLGPRESLGKAILANKWRNRIAIIEEEILDYRRSM